MAPPLTIVPPTSNPTSPGDDYIVTARRLAPYVLDAFARAQREGRRCTLDDLCEQIPVRRADLRRTVSALHANDLLDALKGRLTLRGFAVSVALAPRCKIPVREAIRGAERVVAAERDTAQGHSFEKTG